MLGGAGEILPLLALGRRLLMALGRRLSKMLIILGRRLLMALGRRLDKMFKTLGRWLTKMLMIQRGIQPLRLPCD